MIRKAERSVPLYTLAVMNTAGPGINRILTEAEFKTHEDDFTSGGAVVLKP